MRKITLDEIDSFSVDVSESILPSHLYEFAKFQFIKKSINFTPNSSIFYYYLQDCKSYYFSHFKSAKKTDYIEPLILKAYYSKDENQDLTDLFILTNYFAVYKNQKLIYFKAKKIDVLDSEINNYIKHSLNLKLSRIIKIDSLEEERLQKEFEQNFIKLYELNILKQNGKKELKKFVTFFIACLIVVFGVHFYNKYYQNNQNIEEKQTYFYPQKELITAKLLHILKQIEEFSLKTESISLRQKSLNIVLTHKNKQRLLKFLTTNNAEIKSLQFNTQEGVYELNVLLRLI